MQGFQSQFSTNRRLNSSAHYQASDYSRFLNHGSCLSGINDSLGQRCHSAFRFITSSFTIFNRCGLPNPSWPEILLLCLLEQPIIREVCGTYIYSSVPDHNCWLGPSLDNCVLELAYSNQKAPILKVLPNNNKSNKKDMNDGFENMLFEDISFTHNWIISYSGTRKTQKQSNASHNNSLKVFFLPFLL